MVLAPATSAGSRSDPACVNLLCLHHTFASSCSVNPVLAASRLLVAVVRPDKQIITLDLPNRLDEELHTLCASIGSVDAIDVRSPPKLRLN